MSDAARGQTILLSVLLAVLAVVLWYQFGRSPAQPGSAAPAPARAAAASADAGNPVMDVRLDLLERTPEAWVPPGRDPFQFRIRPVAAPPPVALPPQPPQPPRPPPVPVARGPEPIRMRFIGHYVTAAGRGVAVLRNERNDGRDALVQGSAGDIIEGRYRLLSVTPDVVEIAYIDGRGRQRIARSGQ